MHRIQADWAHVKSVTVRAFKCGHCDRDVASDRGYSSNEPQIVICLCPMCNRPTLFNWGEVFPSARPGGTVEHLPKEIEGLYREARTAAGASAPTACVLALRRLLMHVAVDLEAPEGKSRESDVPLGQSPGPRLRSSALFDSAVLGGRHCAQCCR
jgi:hypothetical protein